MGRRGCASAMGMIKFPSSCSSPKALCNQFIDYYICSRGVFCINHIKLRNFVVITIECSIATVDRGSIMTRIYRWSMMVYSSLQAEFMVTKYDGHIHRYGALVFGKLVIYVSKSIDNNNQIMVTSSNGHIFRVTGPLWGKPTHYRWIPYTKASDAEQPIETPGVCDIAPLWRHSNDVVNDRLFDAFRALL